MKHHFLDYESAIDSPIRRLNPKMKCIALFLVIAIIVSTPPKEYIAFSLYGILAALLLLLSRVPLMTFLKRLLLAAPFIAIAFISIPFVDGADARFTGNFGFFTLTISSAGLMIFWNVLIKSTLSIILLTILISSTPFFDLVSGLRELKIPALITDSFSFMYQYSFILVDETERISRARDARLFSGRWIWDARIIGYTVGSLFLRSLERGERIYHAMKARGYDSDHEHHHTEPLRIVDYLFVASVSISTILIRIFGVFP